MDLVGLYQLVEGKKDPSKSDKAGMPRGNSLSIAAEAAQLQKEQKAKKEFDGSIDNALESLTKMAAS